MVLATCSLTYLCRTQHKNNTDVSETSGARSTQTLTCEDRRKMQNSKQKRVHTHTNEAESTNRGKKETAESGVEMHQGLERIKSTSMDGGDDVASDAGGGGGGGGGENMDVGSDAGDEPMTTTTTAALPTLNET